MKALLLLTFFCGLCSLKAQKPTIPIELVEPSANAAMDTFPDDRNKRLIFMSAFCEPFLDQWRYLASSVTITHGDDKSPYAQGYNAGLKALSGDLKQNSISPSDFGYLNKTIIGTYNGSFESNEFIEDTGERFHTNLGFVTQLPAGKIRINVWMSPETVLGFGHFSQWKQEIIIVEIEDNKS